jgi:hypothetical protein
LRFEAFGLCRQAKCRAFLTDVVYPAKPRVLEVGCGTGVLDPALA